MGTELVQRKCIVFVDTLRIDGLRCAFRAEKTLKKDPNTLDLKVWNLAPLSRGAIQKKSAKVLILAGYEQAIAQVFSGDARTADHRHDRPDWVTHIQCGDGEVRYGFSRLTRSFRAGTKVSEVLRAVADATGLDVSAALPKFSGVRLPGGTDQFRHGHSVHGRAVFELDSLLRSVGLTWSVQDGKLQVLGQTEALPGQAILISPETGLVGSPDHGTPQKKGKPSVLKVKCLLNPQVRCGGLIRVESESVRGQFRVEKVVHLGDTHGAEWFTETESLPS